jgi:transposase
MVNQNQQYGRQRRGYAPTKCTCPDCGYETEKIRGVPCREKKCPECGTTMMGK